MSHGSCKGLKSGAVSGVYWYWKRLRLPLKKNNYKMNNSTVVQYVVDDLNDGQNASCAFVDFVSLNRKRNDRRRFSYKYRVRCALHLAHARLGSTRGCSWPGTYVFRANRERMETRYADNRFYFSSGIGRRPVTEHHLMIYDCTISTVHVLYNSYYIMCTQIPRRRYVLSRVLFAVDWSAPAPKNSSVRRMWFADAKKERYLFFYQNPLSVTLFILLRIVLFFLHMHCLRSIEFTQTLFFTVN